VQAAMTVLGRVPPSDRGRLDLHGTDLRRVLLIDAHLERASLADAHLEGALLIGARLEGATLAGAHLEQAIFTSLKWADLTAQPGSAYLPRGKGFVGDLPAASLEGADLTSAHLEGAALAGARADEETRWPDGFDWQIVGVVMQVGE